MKYNSHSSKLAYPRFIRADAWTPAWILLCCAMALQGGCATREESPGDRVSSQLQVSSAATQQDVAQMLSARAQVWNQLAANLPDGQVLSIELIHSQPDQPFAVYTVVKAHQAVQNVVGHPPTAAEFTSAEAIALGEPPPKQPPEPGIVVQGTSLLNTAFGQGAQAVVGAAPARTDTQRAAPGSAGGAQAASVSKDLVDRVLTARWQAWTERASKLPDGYVLSISLLRSQANPAFVVYVVVKNHMPIQNVVGDSPPIGADDPASPNIIALGVPPPKQPPEPGIIAQGTSLLSTAFSTP
jgi:hypothetical protein